MKVALAQINSDADVAENLHRVDSYSQRAGTEGADLVVFPEAMMSAFGTDLIAAATTRGEFWRSGVRAVAIAVGVPLVVGEFEATGSDRVRNVLAVYLPDGSRHTYAKIHLYDAFGYTESDSVEPGNTPLILDIAGAGIGFAVCYDIRFPNLFTVNARHGAAVTVVSASWGAGPGKVEQWELLARARALDSTSFVVAVGQADPQVTGADVSATAPTGVGHSLAVDPYGNVLGQLGPDSGLQIVDLDLDLVEQARASIPVLANARSLG
jgi:Predicted amidohydrolase